MLLNIYSLKKPALVQEIRSINFKTTTGELTILDHHIPLITLITKGSIKMLDAHDKVTTIDTDGGILEVRPENRVNILLN